MPDKRPPIVVIYGDEEFQKARALQQTLDPLIPPDVERGMVLCEYDAGRGESEVEFAAVMDDLATCSFFADLRVVVVREADKFVSTYREKLEHYAEHPAPCGVLVLVMRSFPRNTRLFKAVAAAGGRTLECKALGQDALVGFVIEEARRHGKRLDRTVAIRLVERIGAESGMLAGEVEKLALYIGDSPQIAGEHVDELVGLSREEKIFAVMDAAAAGDRPRALALWNQTLATDKAAAFKAVAGIAFVLRRWLAAHELAAGGMPVRAIAPKVMMWGRERELADLLRRRSEAQMKRLLAQLADLDAQVKSGTRSIETGVEALLTQIAA